MSEEEIDTKIKRLKNELSDLKTKRKNRLQIVEKIRKTEFLRYFTSLFQTTTFEELTYAFEAKYWCLAFADSEIKFAKSQTNYFIAKGLALTNLCIFYQNKLDMLSLDGLSIKDYKLIGKILQVAEFDKLNRMTQIYLDSCYPETLQSVLLILGTLKDSVFNLIGKDVTKIICQLALRGCLVK